MKRSAVLGTVLLLLAPLAPLQAGNTSQPSSRPNMVVILADDLGWAELGCYGNRFNETPRLDGLARQGMRFTNAYAAAPVCSPYRAGLISGQYPARVGITDGTTPSTSPISSAAAPPGRSARATGS